MAMGNFTKKDFVRCFKKIPKAELIKRLYMRRFPGLSQEEADTEIQKTFTYSDLNGFIKGYLAVQDLYESEEDLECVFADLKDYLVRNGIVYAEIFASPSSLVKKGFDFFKMVEIYRRNIMKIKF